MADAPLTIGGCPSCGSRSCVAMQCSRVDAETLADQLQRMVKRATPSPPVAAVPATPVALTKHERTRAVLDRLQAQEDGHNRNPFRPLLERLMANTGAYSVTEIGQLKYALDGFYGAAQPQPQPAQPLTGAAPLSDEQIAIRAACSQIIKSLADIVTAPIDTTDKWPFAETVRREPLMRRVEEIKAQVDAIHKVLPLPLRPMMQAGHPTTPTPKD